MSDGGKLGGGQDTWKKAGKRKEGRKGGEGEEKGGEEERNGLMRLKNKMELRGGGEEGECVICGGRRDGGESGEVKGRV